MKNLSHQNRIQGKNSGGRVSLIARIQGGYYCFLRAEPGKAQVVTEIIGESQKE